MMHCVQDYESSQLSWEQRELELEQQLRRERSGSRWEKGWEGDGGKREGEREIRRTEEAEVKRNQVLIQVKQLVS